MKDYLSGVPRHVETQGHGHVSVMLAAAWTVTAAPLVLASALIPSSMAWKKGLSRPLMTAATSADLPPDVPALPAGPAALEEPLEAIMDAIRKDKKRQGDDIHFVLLDGIGRALIERISIRELEGAINDLR